MSNIPSQIFSKYYILFIKIIN